MKINSDKLKSEIQTGSGLLSKMKDDFLPSTSKMAELAFEKLMKEEFELMNEAKIKDFIKKNTSYVLKRLLQLETEIYLTKEKKIYRNFVNHYLEYYYGKDHEFKELEKVFSQFEKDYSTINFSEVGNIISELYEPMKHVVFSAAQSRKTRVGQSLENHFENILKLLGVPYIPQVDIDDSIIDFVLPNLELLDENPRNCIFLASQTTLKDRFRLSLSKISKKYSGVRKNIITASGLGIITNKDKYDLTETKVAAIKNHDFNLVVFKEVKESKFKGNKAVMSYEELINNDIEALSGLWS